LRDRLDSVRRRVLQRLGLGAWAVPPVESVAGLSQQTLRQVWATLLEAKQRYRPQRQFRGKVLLFQAEIRQDWAATVLDDPLYGWSKWATDGVERYPVPGSHLDVFRECNLAPLAATLRERLNALMPAPRSFADAS
jgi:thioesterase domain-containing protein